MCVTEAPIGKEGDNLLGDIVKETRRLGTVPGNRSSPVSQRIEEGVPITLGLQDQ